MREFTVAQGSSADWEGDQPRDAQADDDNENCEVLDLPGLGGRQDLAALYIARHGMRTCDGCVSSGEIVAA
jgi:hypothetical protein